MGPALIRSSLLENVPHAFFNAAQSDARRFDLIEHSAGPLFARQVHSADVLAVSAPFPGELPEVDALVTAIPGLALGIVTADCAPVLLADLEAGVVGAAHAGWRGAHGGVIAATVAAMAELGARPASITAAIGPCVAQASYEVDEPFRARFTEADARFFTTGRPGRWQFDLEAFTAAQLRSCGVERIDPLGLDTYADPARFHSFRRSTHRGEPTLGRQFSLIALPLLREARKN
jgi:YfiH family protein